MDFFGRLKLKPKVHLKETLTNQAQVKVKEKAVRVSRPRTVGRDDRRREIKHNCEANL